MADGDPVQLLALLKHPLAGFGLSRPACRQAARALEIALFRGHRVTGGIAALADALERAQSGTGDRRVPVARRRLSKGQWALAADLVARIADCLGALEAAVRSGEPVPVSELAILLTEALGKAGADDTVNAGDLWQGPGGEALSTL